MKIEKIVYEKDNNNIFNKCIVYYEDGTSEVTNNVLGKIFDFMDQEGLNIENVMKSPAYPYRSRFGHYGPAIRQPFHRELPVRIMPSGFVPPSLVNRNRLPRLYRDSAI